MAAHNGGNSKEFGGPIFLGKFTYNPCSGRQRTARAARYLDNINNVNNYQQSYGNQDYTVDDQLSAMFVQDDYRAGKRLTLNGGLRYERKPSPTPHRLRSTRRLRLRFQWERWSIVFRAGFGIYYSQVVDNSEASYALGEPTGVFTYTATPGQVGFPSSIAAAPLPSFPAGRCAPIRSLYVRPGQPAYLNQWFPTSVLNGYPDAMLNAYSEQYTASLEQRFAPEWVMTLDYVGAHTLRIIRPLDVDGPSPFVRTAPGQSRSAQVKPTARVPTGSGGTAERHRLRNQTRGGYPQPPY